MKLQFELWRLCASLLLFGVSFGLARWAIVLPNNDVTSVFLSILCAIFCLVFFAGAIGVLFRRGVAVALFTLDLICAFIP